MKTPFRRAWSQNLVALLLALSLAGCSRSEAPPQESPQRKAVQPVRILSGIYEGGLGSFIETLDLRADGTAVRKVRAAPPQPGTTRDIFTQMIERISATESFTDGVWRFVGDQVEVIGKNQEGVERRSLYTIEPNGDLIKKEGDMAGERYRKI